MKTILTLLMIILFILIVFALKWRNTVPVTQIPEKPFLQYLGEKAKEAKNDFDKGFKEDTIK